MSSTDPTKTSAAYGPPAEIDALSCDGAEEAGEWLSLVECEGALDGLLRGNPLAGRVYGAWDGRSWSCSITLRFQAESGRLILVEFAGWPLGLVPVALYRGTIARKELSPHRLQKGAFGILSVEELAGRIPWLTSEEAARFLRDRPELQRIPLQWAAQGRSRFAAHELVRRTAPMSDARNRSVCLLGVTPSPSRESVRAEEMPWFEWSVLARELVEGQSGASGQKRSRRSKGVSGRIPSDLPALDREDYEGR